MQKILSELRSHDGVLELAPQPGSEHPELSWGDRFFYCAPDGRVPGNRQPYATIVTKDYPEDARSRLDEPGRWRLNIHVGPTVLADLLGRPLEEIEEAGVDHGAEDVLLPHPVYGRFGWVCVVNPGSATSDRAVELLGEAYRADRRRLGRRQIHGRSAPEARPGA